MKWIENRVLFYSGSGYKILDIGFVGNYKKPYLFLNLKKKCVKPKIYGIDINTDSILKHRIPLTFVADGIQTPFRKSCFDIVLCLEFIEHLFCLQPILSEISRILKPNGILLLTTPNSWSLAAFFRFWLGGRLCSKLKRPVYRKYLGAPDHKLFYDPLSLNNLLYENGLQVIELVTKNHGIPVLRRFYQKLGLLDLQFYPFNRLGHYICVAARNFKAKITVNHYLSGRQSGLPDRDQVMI